MMTKTEKIFNWVGWTACILVFLFLLYLLTFPPIILAHYKITGDGGIPEFYNPLVEITFSDFGAPLLWYYNDVWKLQLDTIGQEPSLDLASGLVDGVVFLLVVLALSFPLTKRIWQRKFSNQKPLSDLKS